MQTVHTSDELIVTVRPKDFHAVKDFLTALDMEDYCTEVLDHWNGDKLDDGIEECAHEITTHDGEHFIIIFATTTIHILLKKNTRFDQIKEKLFSYVNY
jgi:hypothetical protein